MAADEYPQISSTSGRAQLALSVSITDRKQHTSRSLPLLRLPERDRPRLSSTSGGAGVIALPLAAPLRVLMRDLRYGRPSKRVTAAGYPPQAFHDEVGDRSRQRRGVRGLGSGPQRGNRQRARLARHDGQAQNGRQPDLEGVTVLDEVLVVWLDTGHSVQERFRRTHGPQPEGQEEDIFQNGASLGSR